MKDQIKCTCNLSKGKTYKYSKDVKLPKVGGIGPLRFISAKYLWRALDFAKWTEIGILRTIEIYQNLE